MVRAACVFSLLVALLFVSSSADYGTNITAQNANGFDVIVLDNPSWATHIQRSWGTHEFFVFGESTLRTINVGRNIADFYAEPISAAYGGWNFPLIDLHTTFYNTTAPGSPNSNITVRLTMGVADFVASDDNSYVEATGPYLPLFSVVEYDGANPSTSARIQKTNSTIQNGTAISFNGYLSYGVRVDPRNIANNDIVTYFAGFIIQNGQITFALTRTHYDPRLGLGNSNLRTFIFDPVYDVFPLYNNQFTTFSATYRPFVHFFPGFGNLVHTFVIVIDPNTMTVYGYDVDAGNQQLGPAVSQIPALNNAQIVSNAVDFINNITYIGIASSGFAPGQICKIVMNGDYSLPAPACFNLPANYSNPKALAYDMFNQTLYIGMNGYSEILKMAPDGTVLGYQRLPEYLHRNWDGIATEHHVYFITYEQNSKVYRVDKRDFCEKPCPYNGYCKEGACMCSYGYVMNSAKTECLVQAAQQIIGIKHHYVVAHDGEIVLGVFFALAVIVAAAGWFQWYKARRSAYQAV